MPSRVVPLGGAFAAVGFVGSVLLANYVTTRFGFIPVGFGFTATAGTLAAGFALALRDATQDAWGRKPVLAVIVAGAVLSFLVSDPFIAIASAAAFLVSEFADFCIYTPLRSRSKLGDRRWAAAVIASNTVGAVIDTAIFLGIAFGASAILPGLAGQFIGKGWATLIYLVAGWIVSRASVRRTVWSMAATQGP